MFFYKKMKNFSCERALAFQGIPEKMLELRLLKQAYLNYCFRAYLAYLSSRTRQARLQALSGTQK